MLSFLVTLGLAAIGFLVLVFMVMSLFVGAVEILGDMTKPSTPKPKDDDFLSDLYKK